MKCIQCNKETKNLKFCSRSCAVSYNNSISPKRKLNKECQNCNKLIYKTRAKYCSDCRRRPNEDYTLKESIYNNHGKQNSYSLIRTRARALAKKLGLNQQCVNCNYNKHVEVAHIKPISDFPLTSKISEINSPDNIVGLCSNCHWEFDHNMLTLR